LPTLPTSAFTNDGGRAKFISRYTLYPQADFASRLGIAGINNLTLQKLGRWKEPKVILRSADLSPEHLVDAVEKSGSHSPTPIHYTMKPSLVTHSAEVAELADALDSGSSGRKAMGVQVPPSAPDTKQATAESADFLQATQEELSLYCL
jgi:hypothetical protein